MWHLLVCMACVFWSGFIACCATGKAIWLPSFECDSCCGCSCAFSSKLPQLQALQHPSCCCGAAKLLTPSWESCMLVHQSY
jgi:hypothetical protein